MTTPSTAPDWLFELIKSQMRLMSSSPRSVADSVWWELQRRSAEQKKADQ
jgi:hypothetical protein